jgi:hypothetical protein
MYKQTWTLPGGVSPKKIDDKSDFVLQQILKKMKEFRISIHLLFIDFKRAHDRADREQIYESMNVIIFQRN